LCWRRKTFLLYRVPEAAGAAGRNLKIEVAI